ncbi:heat stress transcription factor A-4c-like [Raphanus sativus]|uniref:Heat stress transcription factor A-4c-like n=1 Tax=Raphanus sativus TaxID=3726 RepID=A0A6J0KSR1_RAPSA|nr:heat stress transcription factor A-4c-like [Raphanus sativus]
MDLSPRRNRIHAFLSKAYEMVDDPSTDKIISWGPNGTTFVVWKPLKCSRDLLTRHLGITNFARFESYGFSKMTVCGQQLEFECSDFVKGHPELLDKIGDRYVAKLRAFHEKRYKPFEDKLKNAKTKEEWDLAVKEFFENNSKERRESRLRMETSPPPAQVPSNGS